MKLYSTLADWWPLLSPASEYAEEAALYWQVMSRYAKRPISTMLELGCGGGNNAQYLKRSCRMTLTDVSPDMLAVSRAANPECEHVQGDMRTLRLDGRFDAVFIHDAVMYLLTEDDLRQAMSTAYEHCAPGGVALFVPDFTRETWKVSTEHGGYDGGDRALRYLEWTFDPNAEDSEYAVEMVYLLRKSDGTVHVEHERHREGLFSRATWLGLLTEAGFIATLEDPQAGPLGELFVGVRP